jgi:hypothetical protein
MIKETQLEDSMIAYFDGRLSDEESAELMHRVSISPEIRQLFREHEMLRQLATRAAQKVVIRPELEESLFSRIHALAENEHKVLAPIPEAAAVASSVSRFWGLRRSLLVALLLGLLGSGAYLGLQGSETGEVRNSSQPPVAATERSITQNQALTSTRSDAPIEKVAATSSIASHDAVPRTRSTSMQSMEPVSSIESGESKETAITTDRISSPIAQVAARPEAPTTLRASIGAPQAIAVRDVANEDAPSFEIGAMTSSGFSYPANASLISPFADLRISAAYYLAASDLAGIRVGSDLYQGLATVRRSSDGSMTVVTRAQEEQRSLGAEAFYSHRMLLPVGAGLWLEGTAGAGIIPSGTTLSAELGFKLPFSDHMLGGVSFRLTRVHVNAPSVDELMSRSSDEPALFEGSNIHNTLNGRLQYGLSYRF